MLWETSCSKNPPYLNNPDCHVSIFVQTSFSPSPCKAVLPLLQLPATITGLNPSVTSFQKQQDPSQATLAAFQTGGEAGGRGNTSIKKHIPKIHTPTTVTQHTTPILDNFTLSTDK